MKRLHWLLVPALFSVPLPALAAPPAPSPSVSAAQHPVDRSHPARSRLLREKIGLGEEKARKVEAILDRYAPEKRRVATELRNARQKLKALLTLNSEDQTAYRGALEQVRTNRKAMQDLMDRAFSEISKEITPKEQTRLFLALAELRGGMGGHRPKRGGGPDGDAD